MPKKIMLALSNAEGDCDKPIHCEDLDKNDYETKYKGHLTCIKGCKARIKYTVILSILVYTFFSRMFDLMLPPVAKHSIVVA